MKQHHSFSQTSKASTASYLIALVITIFFLNSCNVNRTLLNQENNNYPGTVFLKNGEKRAGQVGMPLPNSKTVLFIEQREGTDIKTFISSVEIERIEFNFGYSSDNVHIVRYMPVRGMFNSISDKWVMQIAKGQYASAYIGAEGYSINHDGSISLSGTRQVLNHGTGTAIINPSFPVYMIKDGDKVLTNVALKEGVSFEGSAFRSGVSRYLSDDSQLCEYMRQEKWDFENLEAIIRNYNPDRGGEKLIIDGIAIEPKKKGLFTDNLDREMLFYVESAIPSDDIYGTQFAIGIRTSAYKFLSYGADLGYASAKYIDQVKRIENHPGNWVDTPISDDDFSKQSLFRFNTFLGGQLPFDLRKFYLIPAAHITFGGMLGNGYSTLNYGPMVTLDFGFKMKRGDILLIGAGYRHNIPLKGDEGKAEASAPGFEAYEPYDNLLIRLSYKF